MPSDPRLGLCAHCAHARRLPHPRGGMDYLRCKLAAHDPRFPRYPALPVRACTGYRPEEPARNGNPPA